MWGATGGMQNPPQYDWSELHVEGPPSQAFDPLYLARGGVQDGNGWNRGTYPTLWGGQLNDRLNVWGNPVFTPTHNSNAVGGYDVPKFPITPKATISWVPTPGVTCDPTIFPNCDMTDFAASNSGMGQWASWWSQIGDTKSNVMSLQPATIYAEAIERGAQSFATGNYDGLNNINSSDTSSYDPCAGDSLVERIIPLLLGAAGVVLIRVYGAEVFAFLPASSKGYLEGTTFLTLFNVGKAVVDAAKILEDGGESTELDIEQAATALTVGSGITISGVAANLPAIANANVPAAAVTVVCGLIGYSLQPLGVKLLRPAVMSGSALLLLPMLAIRWISKLFCAWSSAGQNACDDFGENNGGTSQGFEDVRRWDVPSLSAKLTEIACGDLSIPRDSERAKFIYRSLVTNPGWMEAATTEADLILNNGLWQEGTANLNPLGLVVQIEETAGDSYSRYLTTQAPDHGGRWQQAWSDERYSFAGGKVGSSIDPVTVQNLFACQNFDVLFNADHCYNPKVPGSNPDLPKCADSAVDTGQDVVMALNMKMWLQAAVEASNDPSNFVKQFQIKGLHQQSSTPPATLPPVEEYLKNAHRDMSTVSGIGFNSVQERGEFAYFYLDNSFPLATGVQETECLANALFYSEPDMASAWAYALQKWDIQDQIAYAHFLYKDDNATMGEAQKDTFDAWEGGYKNVRDFRDKHLLDDKGFTADPFITPLAPLEHPIVSLPVPLQPGNSTSPAQRWQEIQNFEIQMESVVNAEAPGFNIELLQSMYGMVDGVTTPVIPNLQGYDLDENWTLVSILLGSLIAEMSYPTSNAFAWIETYVNTVTAQNGDTFDIGSYKIPMDTWNRFMNGTWTASQSPFYWLYNDMMNNVEKTDFEKRFPNLP